MTEQTTYFFSQFAEQTEYERLQLQEATFDWICQGRLTSLGLGPGSACLEAGVGAGSMLRWMASETGPSGRVLGVDLDDRFFGPCQNCGAELRKDDLRTTPFEDVSFDFIHARLLFLHLQPPDRKALLGRFINALRPGGWLVVLDAAYRFTMKTPTKRAEELLLKLLSAIRTITSPNADFTIGDEVPDLLAEAASPRSKATGCFLCCERVDHRTPTSST